MNKSSFSYILSVQMTKFRQMVVKKLDPQKFFAWKSISKVVIATEKIFLILLVFFLLFFTTKVIQKNKASLNTQKILENPQRAWLQPLLADKFATAFQYVMKRESSHKACARKWQFGLRKQTCFKLTTILKACLNFMFLSQRQLL